MSTQILLIRHGQTEWNQVERFRGRAEIDLDEIGKNQAEATATRLSGSGLSALYCSPLKRAVKTAQAIRNLTGVTADVLPDLTDVDYGRWQGLTLEEAQNRDPDVFAHWRHSPQLVRFPQGESMEEVRSRAAGVVETLKLKHQAQTFAIVSHVVVCRLLVLHLLGIETSHFWNTAHDNCGITTFMMKGDLPVATGINDTCHLHRQGS